MAVATAPYSEADAAKRIFDAAKPLKAAGTTILDALGVVAAELRALAASPIIKGDASRALNVRLPDPYLRNCRPCDAIHIYELPFRLAALQAGLELEAGTSPPVLHRVASLDPPDYAHLAGEAEARFEVIRSHLRFFGPFDPYLQLRGRETLVVDKDRQKLLWPILGRPGAMVVDGEVVATWRPKTVSKKLTIRLQPWVKLTARVRSGIDEQAARLAEHRGVELVGVVDEQ